MSNDPITTQAAKCKHCGEWLQNQSGVWVGYTDEHIVSEQCANGDNHEPAQPQPARYGGQ